MTDFTIKLFPNIKLSIPFIVSGISIKIKRYNRLQEFQAIYFYLELILSEKHCKSNSPFFHSRYHSLYWAVVLLDADVLAR